MRSQFHYGSIQIDGKTLFDLPKTQVSIPLWFDSDCGIRQCFVVVKLSQFHYGSIQIKKVFCRESLWVGSQFHYGSIQITDNLVKDVHFLWSQFHYGSIQMGISLGWRDEVGESQFHYGSIQIRLCGSGCKF